MEDVLSRAELKTLIEKHSNGCVSIYLPTHRAGPEIQQDPIRLKNLLRGAEEQLHAHALRATEVRKILAPAQDLVQDDTFWRHQSDGLAIFLSAEEFHYYRLPLTFVELLVVTDRFHVKPLLPFFSSGGRFLILALSQNDLRLFTCTPHHINEAALEGVPTSMDEALQYDNLQKQLQFHTGTPPSGGGKRAAMFHGQGVSIDDTKIHILRYFQEVERGLQKYLRDERVPLVLAGVEYLLPLYREASTYSSLVQDGITGNPEGLSAQELHRQAWPLVQPLFHKAQEEAVAQYQQRVGTGRASSRLEEVVSAAYQGRVDSLFVAVGVQQWGTFQTDSNTVVVHEQAEPHDDDLLDFAAIHTFLNGGMVYAVQPHEVPGNTMLAAVFRY